MSPRQVGERAFSVLLVSASLGVGGQELSTMALAEALLERGHKVTFVSVPGPLAEEVERRGIPTVFARVGARTPAGLLRGATDLRTIVQHSGAQVIHSATVVPAIMGFIAARFPGRLNVKVVWHDRAIKWWSYPVVGRLFNFLVDLVVANSDYERRRLVRNGLSPAKVETVHNGMYIPNEQLQADPNELRAEMAICEDCPVILYVARLSRMKGHRYMLEAMPQILRDFPRAQFIIVGDGPERRCLEALSGDLGICRSVAFTGTRRDVGRFYAAADVVVFPSLWESFGNASIEAMAFGKPVVAAKVGGIPEAVVEGQTGVLVPPRAPDALASAVLRLLQDPELRHRMGAAGLARVKKHFTMERVAADVERVYARVVGTAVGQVPNANV